MTAAAPGWPPLWTRHRVPLVSVARPARGRTPRLCVLTSTVESPDRVVGAAYHLTNVLEAVTGPTRCSSVIVRYSADDDEVLTLLTLPGVTDVVAPEQLDLTLDAYLGAGPSAVLLLAACSVLWRQQAGVRTWS